MARKAMVMTMGTILLVFLFVCSSSAYEGQRMGREVIGRIDKTNCDQYKDILTQGQYYMVKNWEMVMEIVPTVADWKPNPGYIEATEKYKGQCQVDENGNLLNFTAGCPFPDVDPKEDPVIAGAKVAWNHFWKCYGDDKYYTSFTGYILDKNMAQRINKSYTRRLNMRGRTELDPKPEILPNPEKVDYRDLAMQRFPFEVKGLGVLTFRYEDPKKEDDCWLYIPAMRRIRRMSTAARDDTFGGTDTTWDDYYIWCGKNQTQTFKLIGVKDAYHVRHEPKEIFPERSKKFPCVSGGYYEKITAWVVEATPKSPTAIYSKRVWWIDPMFWDIVLCDDYDRKGRAWKSVTMRMFTEGNIHHSHTMEFTDIVNTHGTIWESYGYNQNINLPEEDFTLSALEKFAK